MLQVQRAAEPASLLDSVASSQRTYEPLLKYSSKAAGGFCPPVLAPEVWSSPSALARAIKVCPRNLSL